GRFSGAIEEPRDLLVGHQARQLADQRQRVFGHCPAMLAGSIHLQLQRGVVSALPMQDHLNEAALDAHDDLVQCRAQDPLARCCCRSRVRPGEFEIDAELQQVLPLLLTQGRWLPPVVAPSATRRGSSGLLPIIDREVRRYLSALSHKKRLLPFHLSLPCGSAVVSGLGRASRPYYRGVLP